MRWSVTKTRDEDTWFEDYVKIALSCKPPALPAKRQRLGAVNVSWHQCEPGIAFITTRGGNPADRTLARQYMAAQLAGHGFKQAEYTFDQAQDKLWLDDMRDPPGPDWVWAESAQEALDLLRSRQFTEVSLDHDLGGDVLGPERSGMWLLQQMRIENLWPTDKVTIHTANTPAGSRMYTFVKEEAPHLERDYRPGGWVDERFSTQKTAQWSDIMAKAKRLIQSGQVRILRNGYNDIVGDVIGDHGRYQTEVTRNDPESRAITGWQCDCPWDQFAWQRTRQWKKYEGRPCAHVLATYWQSLSMPIDEDAHPAMQAPPGGAPMPAPQPGPMPPGAAPQQPMPQPGQAVSQPPTPGLPPEIIPPYPMEGEPMGPQVSIPGAKPQSPLNPIQYPGGTFSSVQDWDWPMKRSAWENGTMVQTRFDDQGVWEGRSDAHGAGEYADVPAGSVGEVLGQDPTGMVQVLFMNEATGISEHGRMQPWGISAWFMPSELVMRSDLKRPGPAVKRRV